VGGESYSCKDTSDVDRNCIPPVTPPGVDGDARPSDGSGNSCISKTGGVTGAPGAGGITGHTSGDTGAWCEGGVSGLTMGAPIL